MKRSDIPEAVVLAVFSQPFSETGWRDQELIRLTGAPMKVVWAAMAREAEKGMIEYGTSLRGGWLTPEGCERLRLLREGR